ncbi:hypothetical protein C8R47DRAFT_1214444 [Mycena vitilis]|nr:hypothetical protein C8R47DRAFT_1214444 [Mycena vitilis]
MRLSVFDVLHRTVVYSLLGISGWAVFVGVYGHKERKAAMMEKVKEVHLLVRVIISNVSLNPIAQRMAASDLQREEQLALARAAQDAVPSKR